MTVEHVLEALEIPGDARVGQRVPKKLLVENGAPTARDKRHINDGIEELHWVAALKPATVGVPAFKDDARQYLEIAVLSLALRNGAKADRLAELIHRAIPYPCLLVRSQDGVTYASLAHLRWSQGEAGRMVLDGELIEATLSIEHPANDAFLRTLRLTEQPKSHLRALYQNWIELFEAHAAAALSRDFRPARDQVAVEQRRQALAEYERLQQEIEELRRNAKREKQVARRVETNLRIKQLEAQLAEASTRL
jgi:hypothetical protein